MELNVIEPLVSKRAAYTRTDGGEAAEVGIKLADTRNTTATLHLPR